MEHRRKRSLARGSRWVIVSMALAAFAAPPAARAARGVINANQHPVLTSDGCNHEPAFPTLAASPHVSAQAYHVDRNPAVFAQARCYNHHERPRIFSDDASFATGNGQQKLYIQDICRSISVEDPDYVRGVEHYEHWESSLTPLAKNGATIGGFNTWPLNGDAQLMMQFFATDVRDNGCANQLAPNGTLKRDTGSNPRRLLWNGSGATLIGLGHMGALTAGSRTLLVRSGQQDGYLGTLRHYGANLTRIWFLDQWSGLATCHTPHLEVLTPFSGTLEGKYNLSVEGLNPAFFRRLREFAQLSADRGIVVEADLFDRHGLVNRECLAQWGGSPYNMLHNTTPPPDPFINGSGLNTDCDCGLCGREALENPAGGTCNTIDDVLIDSRIVPIHRVYLQRVAQEVGGVGNMIFEVMNEMYAGRDWPEIGEDWQTHDVAERLNLELPVFVTRDAFNDEDAVTLVVKHSDDNRIWQGVSNAYVAGVSTDPETGIRMGLVKGSPTSTTNEMKGSLPLGSGSPTGLSVRADIWRGGNSMELGISSGNGQPKGELRVEVTPLLILSPNTRVAIVKRLGSETTILASTTFGIGAGTNVRLFVGLSNPSFPTGTVFVDSAPLPALTNVSLSTLPALNWAYFRGSTASGYYTDTSGWVDNFDADIFCNNTGAPFYCTP